VWLFRYVIVKIILEFVRARNKESNFSRFYLFDYIAISGDSYGRRIKIARVNSKKINEMIRSKLGELSVYTYITLMHGVSNGISVGIVFCRFLLCEGRQLLWTRARFALSAITHIVSVPCLPRERAFKRAWVRVCRVHACVHEPCDTHWTMRGVMRSPNMYARSTTTPCLAALPDN